MTNWPDLLAAGVDQILKPGKSQGMPPFRGALKRRKRADGSNEYILARAPGLFGTPSRDMWNFL